MNYVRIFSDASGESHFEDVSVPTATVPAPHETELSAAIPVAELLFRRVDGSTRSAWHVAPRRQFVVHVEGEVEVEVSDGERRRFSPGSVVLLEDTTGAGHITYAVDGGVRTTLFIAL